MRYWLYDEDNILTRKFYTKAEAEMFMQEGWRIAVQPKITIPKPCVETHGEARW